MSANEPIEATGTESKVGSKVGDEEGQVSPVAARKSAGSDRGPNAAGDRGRGRRARAAQGNDSSGRTLREMEGPDARVAALVRAASRRVCDRPLTALAAALGVGFVVGGALSFRAGRIALAAAGRHVVQQILKQVL